jgi:pimeloyl-ACP methyl ester carboxylesterase
MGFITTKQHTFHYHHYEGKGPDIILLHGLASNLYIWNLIAPVLANDFNVYTIDQRGHGLSAKPDLGYDFESITQDLNLICIELMINNPIIVGHSWGANVVIDSLARDTSNYYKGGILVDGGVLNIFKNNKSSWDEISLRLAPPVLTHLSLEQLLERVRNNRQNDWNKGFEDVLINSFKVIDGNVQPRLSRDHHMKILFEIWNQDVMKSLQSISTPVLILPVSNDDTESESPNMHGISKREAVEIALSTLTNSSVQWLRNTIHDVPVQNPNLVIAAILEAKLSLFN